jgi:hypothetical protein
MSAAFGIVLVLILCVWQSCKVNVRFYRVRVVYSVVRRRSLLGRVFTSGRDCQMFVPSTAAGMLSGRCFLGHSS